MGIKIRLEDKDAIHSSNIPAELLPEGQPPQRINIFATDGSINDDIEISTSIFNSLIDFRNARGENSFFGGFGYFIFDGSAQKDKIHNGFSPNLDENRPDLADNLEEMNKHTRREKSSRKVIEDAILENPNFLNEYLERNGIPPQLAPEGVVETIASGNIPNDITGFAFALEAANPFAGNIINSHAGNDELHIVGGGASLFDGGDGTDVLNVGFMSYEDDDKGPASITVLQLPPNDPRGEYVVYWGKEGQIENIATLKNVESIRFVDHNGDQHGAGLDGSNALIQITRDAAGNVRTDTIANPLIQRIERNILEQNAKIRPDIEEHDQMRQDVNDRDLNDLIEIDEIEKKEFEENIDERDIEDPAFMLAMQQADKIQPDANAPKAPGEVEAAEGAVKANNQGKLA